MPGTEKSGSGDPLALLGRELLQRYVINDRIAQGGMSVVYRGLDHRLQRPVCVKVFHGIDPRQAAYQTSYEHFVQEAFALSQLQHPNTLRIYDFGYLDEGPRSPFHVSEYMDGGTLAHHLRDEGPVAPEVALEILEPIVGALSEAHERGIIHRDIKPTNILFGRAGPRRIVKLADFGIAKAQHDGDSRAMPNRAQDTHAAGKKLCLYSPGWAAPEQLRAEPVGPTADIFALGLLTAFLLTGKKVFAAQGEIQLLESRAAGDPFIERALENLQLSDALTRVLRGACRTAVRERPQSVDDFYGAVKHAFASAALSDSDVRTNKFERQDVAVGVAAPVVAAGIPEARPAREPLLVLATTSDAEVVAAGRRVRMLPAVEQLEVGGDDGPLRSAARFRLTLLPDADRRVRLHVKGLNCFVAKPGGRPSAAVDIDGDMDLELLSPARARLDVLRCAFGVLGDTARLFPLGAVTLAVPIAQTPQAILLDLGPGRELALFHRPAPADTGTSTGRTRR